MENLIAGTVSKIFSDLGLADGGLGLATIALLVVLLKYYIIPIKAKLDAFPSDEVIDKHFTATVFYDAKIKDIQSSLENLCILLNKIADTENTADREIKQIKEDVEKIKVILNQFQGHMMYNANGRNEFGNRELR